MPTFTCFTAPGKLTLAPKGGDRELVHQRVSRGVWNQALSHTGNIRRVCKWRPVYRRSAGA